MRRYSLTATDTNTAGTTMWTLGSATTIRPALYDFIPSSVATPADNAMQCDLKRCTALGTSTAVTAVELDPGDPIVVNQHIVMTHGPHPEYQPMPIYPAQYVTQVVPAADFKGETPPFVQTVWPGAPGTMPQAPKPTVAAPLVGGPARSTVKADAKADAQ